MTRPNNDQQQPVIRFWDWFYLMWVVLAMFLLYVTFALIAHTYTFLPLIPLIIMLYPHTGYYLTCVAFYEDYMVIRRPLFFFKKTIPYNGISKMYETKGKGSMVRVYLMDNTHFWSFTPPSPKIKKEMISFVTSKGIEYDYNN